MQFDLDNPKNGSQDQLYKMRLAVEQLAGEFAYIAKSFVAKGKSKSSLSCISRQNAEGENQESEKALQNRLFS